MLQEIGSRASTASSTGYQDESASHREEITRAKNPGETQRELAASGATACRLLTIGDVAEWLGVSKAWVYDHTTRKKPMLPCVRLGEMTRFRRQDIEEFIQEHLKFTGPK